MKFHLLIAVLSCALLSLSHANVTEEQSLTRLEEESQNVDKQLASIEEPLLVVSPEVEKVLNTVPELVQVPAADETISDRDIEEVDNNTEAIVIPQNTNPVNNREPKQLIGFIPAYVLREAIRLAQEQQSNDVRSLRYESDEADDASDEIEEERAIRRRKRFRRRNSKGHLKKSRRHKNSNKRNLKKHRKVSANRKTQNRHGSMLKKKSPKKSKSKKRKTNQRRD